MREKIGEYLVRAGLITPDNLNTALAEHRRTGEPVGAALVRLDLATEEQIARALARQLGFPFMSLVHNTPDAAALETIPKAVAIRCACVAIRLEQRVLTVAVADPLLFSVVAELQSQTHCRIEPVVATRTEIMKAIELGYPDTPPMAEPDSSGASDRGRSPAPIDAAAAFLAQVAAPTERGDEAAVDDLVDQILRDALKRGATDVHVEPTDSGTLVRFRLDGVLNDILTPPAWIHEAVVARCKLLAGLNTTETHLPQDGRLRLASRDGVLADYRVSIVRTRLGEKVVLRALDVRRSVLALGDTGMSAVAQDAVRALLARRRGLIVVAGPAASGKTSTLSSLLQTVRSAGANIITIEDPIEYAIPGVNQTQIDEALGLTFVGALRSMLLQDPDVIMLGELRDGETAALALQAAQDRLVLTALRADDAPSVIARLLEFGIEARVVASALAGVIAQRLVRRLCQNCRREEARPANLPGVTDAADVEADSVYRAVGCDQCNHTGYRGRVGIYEVLPIGDRLRELVTSSAPADQLREAAMADGMTSLGEDGLAKVRSGMTTQDELFRVAPNMREPRALCSDCGFPVAVDFVACPRCGTRRIGSCPHCGRALRPGWHFCPYCAHRTDDRPAAKQPAPQLGTRRTRLPGPNVAEFRK